MSEEILIGFPNLDPEYISRSVIEKWLPTDARIIGDTTFFVVGGTHISMETGKFLEIFKDIPVVHLP